MPEEVGGFVGGTSGRDVAGIVPASRGAHRRPLHPRLASLCSGQEIDHHRLFKYHNEFASRRRGSVPAVPARREEVTQVEIESGTQVASRGPTWRIATPRYGMGATAYPFMVLRRGG